MAIRQNSVLTRRFVTAVLPWLIGIVALGIYLATMSRWATLASIPTVAHVSGWIWVPDFEHPVNSLLLYPFQFLPKASIPLALNAFNAVLAALVLVLLARAVSLLPRDRTADQRELEPDENGLLSTRTAWIPPVLTAIGLGLQISFWENATSITGEMIDLLVLTYIVRCLLEFRIDPRNSWLIRAAFLYAADMTNNWALIGLSPIFLIAVIWLKGLSFFNARFLIQAALSFVAGLLLYLLLPTVYSLSAAHPVDFMPTLLGHLKGQKHILTNLYYYLKDNYRVVVLAATSLLPMFVISIRWKSSFGDDTPLGAFITKGVFHIVHALFLVICLLVLLSPPFSPRQMVLGMPFLAHYLFTTLTVGYCAGYFLLVCKPAFKPLARMHVLLRTAGYFAWGGTVAMLVVLPLALVGRNLEPIRLTNGLLLDDLMRRTTANLPAGPAMILCDDASRLLLTRAYLQHEGRSQDYLFYDSRSAPYSDYHAAQLKSQPLWPTNFAHFTNSVMIRDRFLIGLLEQQSAKLALCYLHPGFGYYFEWFNATPQGSVYTLTRYPTNTLLRPTISAETVQLNEQFWKSFDAEILPLLQANIPTEDPPNRPGWINALMLRLHLTNERVLTAETLGHYYSRAATDWAVEMQHLNRWAEGAKHLERALALHPKNLAAEINQAYNTSVLAGKPTPAKLNESIEDRFGRYTSWDQVLGDCGPFDEPRFTFEQGRTFTTGGLYRQALHELLRATELQPRELAPRIHLGDLYSRIGQPAETLALIREIRQNATQFGVTPANEPELVRVEVTALFKSDEKEKARARLASALVAAPADEPLAAMAVQLYLQSQLYAEAIGLLDRTIAKNPADVLAQANHGFACLQLNRLDEARESLTRALELDPKNSIVRLNRAITRFRSKRYDDAIADYTILLQEFPNSYQANYGLAEIAAAKNDPATATTHFEAYLQFAPRNTPEFLQVSNRLVELRAGTK